MGILPLLRDRDLQVMSRNGLMERGAFERSAGLGWIVGGVDPPAPWTVPIRRSRYVRVGAATLLLEFETGIHDDAAFWQAAEPFGHRCLGPVHRTLGGVNQVVAAAEGERGIGAELLIECRQVGGAEHPLGNGTGFGFDGRHLLVAELLDGVRVPIDGREAADPGTITVGPVRQRRQRGAGPRLGDVLRDQKVPVSDGCRYDLTRNDRQYGI